VRARELIPSLVRLGLTATVVAAIAYQYASIADRPSFSAGNFFGFFTIQSNILAAGMLALTALVRPRERTAVFDAVRGAVTLYIGITGVVFALLLSGLQEELQTTIPWVDFVLHKLVPVVLVADWLLDPQRHRLRYRVAVAWLAYPAAWFAYTVARGASADWYPYPFVDVNELGYGGVAWRAAILLVGFAAAAMGVAWIGNRRAARWVDGAAVPA
jgi:hypothetical protein